MSRGHTTPLTCCDRECAGVNGCWPGGVQCDECGLWFCASDLSWDGDNRLCDDCRAAKEQEECENDSQGT